MGIKMSYLVIFFTLLSLNIFTGIVYPDFMLSMSRKGNDFNKFEEYFNECYKTQNLEIYRTAYTRNILLSYRSQDAYRIPKIVHQIWLGSSVPEKYTAWMRSWSELAGWEYKLWTEEDVKLLKLYNQELYDHATNYGEKSDVLRLELLLHYGGIYADIDFECINGDIFDELHRSYDFYAGLEPIDHGTVSGTYKICNAIIGACPHHPIVKNLIIGMRSNWQSCWYQSAVQKSGPDYYSKIILDYEKGDLSSPETREKNMKYRNIYLPCTFFYPFSETDIRTAKNSEDLKERISPETAAIHYWSGSWLFQGGR